MSDEYNKGWNSVGPQRTYEAQQGQFDRRQRDHHAREAAESAAADAQRRFHVQLASVLKPHSVASSTAPAHPVGGGPATLAGCVKAMAVLGTLAVLAYAAFVLRVTGWTPLAVWGVQGALAGAASGVALYAVIVLLRIAVAVVATVLKVAFYAALVLGALYTLSRLA
jgi:hypothetical protein